MATAVEPLAAPRQDDAGNDVTPPISNTHHSGHIYLYEGDVLVLHVTKRDLGLWNCCECFCLGITLRSHLICISSLNGFLAVMLNKIQLITLQTVSACEEKTAQRTASDRQAL